jgi:hypothetical protein
MSHTYGKVQVSSGVLLVSEDGKLIASFIPALGVESLQIPLNEAVDNAKYVAEMWNTFINVCIERDRLEDTNKDLLNSLQEVLSEIQAIIDDGTLREEYVKNHPTIIKAQATLAKAGIK